MITIEEFDVEGLEGLHGRSRKGHPGDEPEQHLARGLLLGVVGLQRAKGPEHAGSVDALLAVVESLRPPPVRRWTWRLLDVDGSLIEVALYR